MTDISNKKQLCGKYTAEFPDYTPVIYTIIPPEFIQKEYGVIRITGKNFFPFEKTYVKINDIKLTTSYFNSNEIRCEIPTNVPLGIYNVYVVNAIDIGNHVHNNPNLLISKEMFTIEIISQESTKTTESTIS